MPQAVASLDSVSKRFGAIDAVTQLTLQLQAGQVTALLGPNGAGKSTSAGLLIGRVEPDAGDARLFGLPPRHPEARARLGVMLQQAGLPETLTVGETIALQSSAYRRALRLPDVLAIAGLEDIKTRRCDRLSGGQKRRVQFALALCGAPDLLVLDEPTTGLDAPARRALWGVVRAKADQGCAILLATHDLEEASALADRIVVIAQGAVCVDGSPAAIQGQAAHASIRVRSGLSREALERLPFVTRVALVGADTEILSTRPRRTLEALFSVNPDLEDIRVEQARLEDALEVLTSRSLKEFSR